MNQKRYVGYVLFITLFIVVFIVLSVYACFVPQITWSKVASGSPSAIWNKTDKLFCSGEVYLYGSNKSFTVTDSHGHVVAKSEFIPYDGDSATLHTTAGELYSITEDVGIYSTTVTQVAFIYYPVKENLRAIALAILLWGICFCLYKHANRK